MGIGGTDVHFKRYAKRFILIFVLNEKGMLGKVSHELSKNKAKSN